MIRTLHPWTLRGVWARLIWWDTRGAQLVEFAVALPLLVVFVVGIFDFSGAFTLKQKLTNATRDAARAAAADPASDLFSSSTSTPVSVNDAYLVVYNYLFVNNINTCGMTSGTAPSSTSGLTWTYVGTSNCPPGGLTIIVNRGYYFAAAAATQPANVNCQPLPMGGSAQTAVIGTCVGIQQAYQWRFGRAASLLGATALLPPTIAVASVAMNEN